MRRASNSFSKSQAKVFSPAFPPRSLRLGGCILFCLLALAAKKPAPPPIPVTYSTPSAAFPGATTDITFDGAISGDAISMWTSFPAETSPLASENNKPRFRLKLPATASVGIGAVRVTTTKGTSSLQLFMIDDLPTATRATGPIPLKHPQEISPPIAIDGACEPLTADCFAFTAHKGQRICIDAVAGRLGSKLDPVLRLLDSSGRELAFCDDAPGAGSDARLAHTFAQDGRYLIELRDANYEGSPNHRYRLRIGDFPLVTAPFPLMCKRGSETQIAFAAVGAVDPDRLQPVTLKFPADTQRALLSVKYPPRNSIAQGSAFVSVIATDADVIIASQSKTIPITIPSSINGHFAAPSAEHRFTFSAHQADHLSFRGQTRSLGSPCELFLQLLKPDGTPLFASKPTAPDEGTLDVTIPTDAEYTLSAQEVTRASGPGIVYALEVARVTPGFSLSVDAEKVDVSAGHTFKLKVKCTRREFDGPITLSLEGLPSACELKNQTIPKGKTETDLEVKLLGPLSTTAPAAVPPLHFKILGKATIANAESSSIASTLPALKRLFPRLASSVPELDGLIALSLPQAK